MKSYKLEKWKHLLKEENWNPAANMFPMMGEEDGELAGLVTSIQSAGLKNAIVLLEGKILDGRNRLLACKLAGVEPFFVDWDGTGDPSEWVVTQNANRRMISQSQKAVAALYVIKNFHPTEEQKKKFTAGGAKWDRRIFICNMFGGLDRHFFSDIVAIEKWSKMEASDRWPIPSSRLRPDVLEGIKSGLHSISSMCRNIDFWIAQANDPTVTEQEMADCPTGQLAREFVALIPKHIMAETYKQTKKWLKGEKLDRLNRYWERMDKEYTWNKEKS